MKDIITRIIDELIDRFNESNWEAITLTMKPSNATVTIEPCFNGNEKNPDTVEFFLLESPAMTMWGSNNWQDLARRLHDFEKDRVESLSEKERCHEFYEKNIMPYSREDIRKGNKYFSNIHKLWLNVDMDLSDFMNDFCYADIAKDNDTPEHVKELVQLSWNCSTYSDWHKDIYGYRP